MTIEIYDGTTSIFNSQITRFSLMESMLSVMLVGGYVSISLQKNKIYRVSIVTDEETLEWSVEFMSYNYNVQSMFKVDPQTNQFVFDTDGEKIIENVRGDNSLLFKAF